MARAQGPIEQAIRKRVADHPDATWLKWKDEEVPWRDVLSYTQRAANGLLELGVRPGEKVALLLPNRPEFLWAHLGIIFIGAHSVPVNTSQRGGTLAHILSDSDAVCAIVHEDLRDALLSVREQCPELRTSVVLDGKAGEGIDWDFDRLMEGADAEPDVDLDEPSGGVGMMYTSGTTGPPKGVVATKYDTSPLADHPRRHRREGRRDALHAAAPVPRQRSAHLVHRVDPARRQAGAGRTVLRLPVLGRLPQVRGGRVQHAGRDALDPAQAAGEAERHRQPGAHRAVGRRPARPVAGVRAALRRGHRRVLRDGRLPRLPAQRRGEGRLDGQAHRQHRLRHHGRRRPTRSRPARSARSASSHPLGQTTHYHKLPEATAEAYRGGWFHSGDLGVVDDEGWWYYKGRKKESMRRLGENISAWEIETVDQPAPRRAGVAAPTP